MIGCYHNHEIFILNYLNMKTNIFLNKFGQEVYLWYYESIE